VGLIEAAAVLLRADSRTPQPGPAAAKGPALEVKTIDGAAVQVHRQTGKVVLVDFMTTTCPSCKQASAGIQAVYQELGGKGFLPVMVAIDSPAPDMLSFYRNLYGLGFPVGMLPREEVLRFLDHPADKPLLVPTLVLLDKRGRVSAKHVGWIGEKELRSAVAKLLDEKM
jgi:thiol-disulfide isomerase/thioredoxin